MTKYFTGSTTKAEYIATHGTTHPPVHLVARLRETNWPDDQRIEIVGGKDTPKSKNSNFYKALQRSPTGEYVKGGKRHAVRDGYTFAVRI